MQVFYNSALTNSNVITTTELLETLKTQHANFDLEEFNKPIEQIDWTVLYESLDKEQLNAKWEVPEYKSTNKTKGSGIISFGLKSGNVLGLGSGVYSNALMLEGLKSLFPQHSFVFGDDTQKSYLKKPISDLIEMQQTGDDDFKKQFKKLMTFQIQFQLYSETKRYQSDQVLDQVKVLYLIRETLAKQVKEDATIKSLPQYKVNGFLNEKYNNFSKDDIQHLSVTVQITPKYAAGLQQEAIIQVQVDPETQEVIVFTQVDPSKTIEQVMNSVKMKQMDLIVSLDNCSVKKQGKEALIIPKLNAINVVLQKTTSTETARGHGLNLSKFSEILKAPKVDNNKRNTSDSQ